jgi:hypothetical protein
VSEGAGQKSFADADRSGEDHVLATLDEMQSEQFVQSCLVQRYGCGPVETLQRAFFLEPCVVEPGLNRDCCLVSRSEGREPKPSGSWCACLLSGAPSGRPGRA